MERNITHHFQVERSHWYRGQGSGGESKLRNLGGAMCLMGFFCKSLGIPREYYTDKTLVDNLMPLYKEQIFARFPTFANNGLRSVYYWNDEDISERFQEGYREAMITKLLLEHGIDVEFVD